MNKQILYLLFRITSKIENLKIINKKIIGGIMDSPPGK